MSNYLISNPIGRVFIETDIHLGKGPGGKDLVYRPDIVFIRAERLKRTPRRLEMVPDLVIEVLLPGSRRLDEKTKFEDYQRLGVREYWLFDPLGKSGTFYRLRAGRFVRVRPVGQRFKSQAVAGFVLDWGLE